MGGGSFWKDLVGKFLAPEGAGRFRLHMREIHFFGKSHYVIKYLRTFQKAREIRGQ